ncbi:hypothetical protein AWB69_05970 [Caballeronia udeis]|uniref:Uncharacterized protein n=1 Tax=Caballeronia udeis TaxID=1232866 RepID=A0A158IGE6_9BURK|nr:hypothetical protein [Caballeronia udeis]SAL55624.1 hypothetical protein AWB69_05970 [Caballeronia udeis]
MAVRKRPAWDLSLSEIEARAKSARVDALLRPQQARADAVSAADREILRAVAQNLTADQVIAISAAMQRGEVPDLTSYLSNVRADSTITGDGLRMVVHHDDSGRPVREFENTGKRKVWMDTFRDPPTLMIRINKKAGQPDSEDNNAYQVRWEEDQRKLASGTYTLPEL